ncbi:hypothetical protein GSUB_00900 [Geoalkalibacter subterraneus]|uniref:Uncharacterized protein n=1 Tax=Geoalkalibacter subterraneus TaxID=483547 RepID=A0A0B5FB93_9BACT|nr:hypothetical protein GSUB_00900 [Geoalkalibacter subterraneus]
MNFGFCTISGFFLVAVQALKSKHGLALILIGKFEFHSKSDVRMCAFYFPAVDPITIQSNYRFKPTGGDGLSRYDILGITIIQITMAT